MEYTDGALKYNVISLANNLGGGQPTSVEEIPVKTLVDGNEYSVNKVTVEKAGMFVNITVDGFTAMSPLSYGQKIKIAGGLPIPLFKYGDGMRFVGFLGVSMESAGMIDIVFQVDSQGILYIVPLGGNVRLESSSGNFTYLCKS